MAYFRQSIGLLKREYELALSNPNRAFVVAFVALMLLGPGLASAFIHPFSGREWLSSGATVSIAAGFLALLFAVRKRAPWLSWTESIGVLSQTALALLILWVPIAISLGFLKPSAQPTVSNFGIALVLAGAIAALACVWGVLRNHWAGYFGEVLLLWAVALALIVTPGTSRPVHPSRDLIPLTVLSNAGLFVMANWGLISKGLARWNEARHSQR